MSEGDGAKNGFGFVDGFFEFGGGGGIGDDAGASLDVGVLIFEEAGTEGDARVVIAVEAEVADGASVGAAFIDFEFVDDLHRANFGGAADGSGGEGGAKNVVGAVGGVERASDVGDDVHDVGIALDDHEIIDFDAAVLGDAADVVSREIDEHEMFGAFFGVGEKVGGECIVFGGGLPAFASSRDGADVDAAVDGADVNFWGAADERKFVHFENEHVGGGIDVAEGAVEVERVAVEGGGKALAGDELEDVASFDVFLSASDHLLVLLAGGVAGDGDFRERF